MASAPMGKFVSNGPVVLYDESDRRSHDIPQAVYQAQLTSSSRGVIPWSADTPGPRALAANASARTPTVSVDHSSRRRYVAGENFFNYEALGSLRPEYLPVDLFTSAFLGLAVNALAAGFVVTLVRYAYRQVLGEYLSLNDQSYVSSLQFLLEWAGCFSVFIGFLSDCRPIGGRRRKPYMILGWVFAALSFFAIVVVDITLARSWDVLNWQGTFSDSDPDPAVAARAAKYGGVLVALTLVATFALQLMWIASLSMTVEFAQREPLAERGKLQALYFILYYVAAAVSQAVSTLFLVGDQAGYVRSKLSVGMVALVLASTCVLPIPFVLGFLEEPPVAGTTVHFSVRRRVHELWRFLHRNVAIRILLFLSLHYFLIGLYNKNVRTAVSTWCDINENKQPTVNAIDASGYVLSLTFWMLYMVNWSWRRVGGIGSVAYILGYMLFTLLVVFDVARNDWFYAIVLAVLDLPKAWIKLYAIVLSTEIADRGREGATMGLVYVAQLLVGICAHMISAGVGNWLPFHVTVEDVLADSTHSRWQVFSGATVLFAVNFLSLLLVLILPQQKLDAQQLRAFGGYNRYASYGVLTIFVLFFCGTSVMNTLSLTK